MFRRLSSSLPNDPEFPADLEKLGYSINDSDQIRMIKDPEQEFHYFISKNERVLEKQREAMDSCIRQLLTPRFQALGLHMTPLPRTAGPSDPHIPILATTNLSQASRILVYLGEANQDLGIFAYRSIGQDSIATGSALNLVAETLKQDPERGIVIANVGQVLWNRRLQKAMTIKSWSALPRKTAVSAGVRVGEENKVEGHINTAEHVASVLQYVAGIMKEGAKVEVVGICEGIEAGLQFLDENWAVWKDRVAAIAIGIGYLWNIPADMKDEAFVKFITERARAYIIHEEPVGTALSGRKQMGCNTYSSGESEYTECIMPRAYLAMLDFLQQVNQDPEYVEPNDLEMLEQGDVIRPHVNWIHGENETPMNLITVSGPNGEFCG